MTSSDDGSTRPAPFGVCVFCGSRLGGKPVYAAAAAELGQIIGRNSWRLIYGGGDVGLMGTVARASLAAGAEVHGIIPRRLLEREAGKRNISELQITETMFARKELMIQAADVFVVLPGGLGTVDELLDAITLRQLGYHAKPVLLADIESYWTRCRALFEQIVAEGFAGEDAHRLYETVPDMTALARRLEAVRQDQGR